MDDVRLTPAERRALEQIEAELRKDRELDRALRRMRLPGTGRRPLRGRRTDTAQDHPSHDDEAPDASGDCTAAPVAHPTPDHHSDRRRAWALAAVLTVILTALLTAGSAFFLVFALVAVTLAASAGIVWLCVSIAMRRPDPG
jgi:hypothetical protein